MFGSLAGGETDEAETAFVGGQQCGAQRSFIVGVADVGHRSFLLQFESYRKPGGACHAMWMKQHKRNERCLACAKHHDELVLLRGHRQECLCYWKATSKEPAGCRRYKGNLRPSSYFSFAVNFLAREWTRLNGLVAECCDGVWGAGIGDQGEVSW